MNWMLYDPDWFSAVRTALVVETFSKDRGFS